MKRLFLLSMPALLIVACSPERQSDAQTNAAPATAMAGSDMKMMAPQSSDSAATKGYKSAMLAMMEKAPPYTGDADFDFMLQMRGHHQAAIDMAEVVLKSGKDPEVKKLATDIIAAQRSEIAQMSTWLSTHKR